MLKLFTPWGKKKWLVFVIIMLLIHSHIYLTEKYHRYMYIYIYTHTNTHIYIHKRLQAAKPKIEKVIFLPVKSKLQHLLVSPANENPAVYTSWLTRLNNLKHTSGATQP